MTREVTTSTQHITTHPIIPKDRSEDDDAACSLTCCNEYGATLHHFPTVVGDALVHTNVLAVDDCKLKSIWFDTDSVIACELFAVQEPRDVGFWLPGHFTFHDVS